MIEKDTFKTIENFSEGIYKEKKSKFLSFAYPVMDVIEIKHHLQKLRQKYYDANHHCFAWKLGLQDDNVRSDDDGEPSGTAGKPILGQIKSHELTNILIVVVRYFGGIKLGPSGLIKAYKTAATEVIANSSIIIKPVSNYFDISFSYNSLNDVMKIVKEANPEILSQNFNLDCSIQLFVRLSICNEFISRLEKVETVKIKFLYSK